MRNKIKLLFICFIQILNVLVNNTYACTKSTDDSIVNLLRSNSPDTNKLRLLALIGEKEKIRRISYWDTLYTFGKRSHIELYQGIALLQIGLVYYQVYYNVNKADSLVKESFRLISRDGNKYWNIKVHSALTGINISKNNLRKALDYSFKGLRLAEEYGDEQLIGLFNTRIGTIYFFTKDSRKAVKHHLAALSMFRKIKNFKAITDAMCDISADYLELHDSVNSLLYTLKTLEYVPFLGETTEALVVYNALGAAYLSKKRFDSSEYFLKKAFLLADKLNSPMHRASILCVMTDMNYRVGKNDLAKKQALEALVLSQKLNFIAQIPLLTDLLKKIYLKERNYKKALEMFELQISTRDSIASIENRKSGAQKEFEYQFDKKENENKLLLAQNQLQNLQLNQSKLLTIGLGVSFLIILSIAYLYSRQNKFKREQENSRLEQKLLRSQMNPHFIFNSLQSIQNYILRHNEKDAVKYLSSFASITRHVLENSRLEAISLTKEISLLENYLLLQKMRFKNKIDYEISVDNAIDPDEIMIPPMLSQPFIENSVEHGFHGIESGGKITVSYFLEGESLLLEILDNGIGMTVENSTIKNHQSMALEITKERVALMNRKKKGRVHFTISEGFPLNEGRQGVRINFSLPLNYEV